MTGTSTLHQRQPRLQVANNYAVAETIVSIRHQNSHPPVQPSPPFLPAPAGNSYLLRVGTTSSTTIVIAVRVPHRELDQTSPRSSFHTAGYTSLRRRGLSTTPRSLPFSRSITAVFISHRGVHITLLPRSSVPPWNLLTNTSVTAVFHLLPTRHEARSTSFYLSPSRATTARTSTSFDLSLSRAVIAHIWTLFFYSSPSRAIPGRAFRSSVFIYNIHQPTTSTNCFVLGCSTCHCCRAGTMGNFN